MAIAKPLQTSLEIIIDKLCCHICHAKGCNVSKTWLLQFYIIPPFLPASPFGVMCVFHFSQAWKGHTLLHACSTIFERTPLILEAHCNSSLQDYNNYMYLFFLSRRRFTNICLDAVSGYLVELQSINPTLAVQTTIGNFKSLQAKLERLH